MALRDSSKNSACQTLYFSLLTPSALLLHDVLNVNGLYFAPLNEFPDGRYATGRDPHLQQGFLPLGSGR